MKNSSKILLIGFILATILCSCGKSGGDKFIGTWQKENGSKKLVITAAGETAYTVELIEPQSYGVNFTNTMTATFQDGNLVSGGTVICSYSDNKIIFDGEEYRKVK